MSHPTEQKTPNVEARISRQEREDIMYSATPLRNKRNSSEEEENYNLPVEAFDDKRTPTKNKENLSTDTDMIEHDLEKVWFEVLGHDNEPKEKTELQKVLSTLHYITEESGKLLEQHTLNKSALYSGDEDEIRNFYPVSYTHLTLPTKA